MTTTSVKALIAACALTLWPLCTTGEVRAQARIELIPTTEIPHSGYGSWSLFLVCNPAWIIENGDAGVEHLFWEYKAFGDSIGKTNLAIWFWKRRAAKVTVENTDIERSSEYCQRYKLLPSESPHVLVTTSYPNDPEPGDRIVIKLNGLSAHDSALALAKLADKLLVTGVDTSVLDKAAWWQRLFDGVTSSIAAAGCYFNKVSFSIKTGVFNAEIEHSTDSAHADQRC